LRKKVKAHCKVVFVLGEREGKRMILGVRVESSYGDERKMFFVVAERAKGEDRREGEICWRWIVWQEHRDFEGGEEDEDGRYM
jgi:hypothetical protein